MPVITPPARLADRRRELARKTILDAAHGILSRDRVEDFSVRQLAAEAGVSPVTVFNHFGTKQGILRALAERDLSEITRQFEERRPAHDVVSRAMTLLDVSMDVYLAEPTIFRATLASFFFERSGINKIEFDTRSVGLWQLALNEGEGLNPDLPSTVRDQLPKQLAITFAGVLMLYLSGDLSEAEIDQASKRSCGLAMLGFLDDEHRDKLVGMLASASKI
ncbi:TetR/AcrR family transcriptional regulator [Aquisediminimonas profunda]|uniref:TetR/AcrR family transcriptional regulator n=1 Tax=Aquisediminimonas profunda TaxID=1550733 RepID=UPI001C634F6E|nr:TetR/AcrR family transcriptional regulator [Aquisediminimonas profunda]